VENQDACPLKRDQTSHILDYQAAAVKLCGCPGIYDAGPASAYVLSCQRGHPHRRQLSAKCKSNNLSSIWCDRCEWHGTEAHVSMLLGQHRGLLSPTSCVRQEATVQLSIHGLSGGIKRPSVRGFALFRIEGMLAYVRERC